MLQGRSSCTRFIVGVTLAGACLGIAIGQLASEPGETARAAPLKQASSPAAHVVISEFRTRGPGGVQDEFVELFNPTGNPIDVSDWQIRVSDNAGVSSLQYTLPPSTNLLPGRHYLIVGNSYSGSVMGESGAPLSSEVTDDGGIALVEADGITIADQVGLSSGSIYREDTTLTPLGTDEDRGYERKPGGASGSCYDTNDNSADFSLISPSDPQNSSSPVTICAGSETATPTNSATPRNMATVTPVAPVYLVISEFRTRGPNGMSDEFVELFNPSGAAVNIGGWMIKISSGCGTSISTLVKVATGVVLQPGGHYLVAANGGSLTITADQTFSTSISDDGGIALVDAEGDVIDQAGMCISTQYREGTPLIPLSGSSDESYARNPIGAASGCYDVNNNAADFSLISPSAPQNRSSPLAMCPGVVLSTPTSTPTRTPTRTPTSTITPIPGVVVINEFLPHPRSDWNGDGTANVGDEYIELMNLGVKAVSLLNWKLDNGGGSSSYTLPDLILEPRAIARFFHADTGIALSDGGGTVRLLKPGGQIVDAYTYGVVEAADISWCRLPGGNGSWIFACRPTPGRPNARAESGYLTPTPSSAPGGQSVPESCPLADTVPASLVQAECGESRTAIWNRELWGEGKEFWLESRFKWGMFIQ